MDKRWLLPIGLTLVVGVAIGLIAGMGSGGSAVAGTATAADVRPVPVVGDCLMGGPDGPFPFDDSTGELYDAPYAGWLGTCDGVRYGEVTAVLDGEADGVQDDGTVSGRLQADCDSALSTYVGAPDALSISVTWWPAFAGGSTAVRPDPRQRAVGQDWAACIIRPPYWGPDGRQGQVGSDGYTTVGDDSVRDGWNESEPRNRLGYCYDEDPTGEVVEVYCGGRHDIETLALTYGDAGSAQQLTESCRAAAGKIIGRDDPTFGGAVTVAPYIVDRDGVSTAVTADTTLTSGDRVDCDARPADQGQQLTSTLASWGEEDPPLTTR